MMENIENLNRILIVLERMWEKAEPYGEVSIALEDTMDRVQDVKWYLLHPESCWGEDRDDITGELFYPGWGWAI